MSSRIVPLAALSVMLLVIFWAVVATAQQPGVAPVGGQFLPIQPGDVGGAQPEQQQFVPQVGPGQPGGVQPGVGQPGFGQPVGEQPIAGQPAAPFQLNPQEQAYIDRVLDDWQAVSGRVKTLEADFVLYEYNGVFGQADTPVRKTTGRIRYAAPDKGHYETDDEDDKKEKWVCTGTAIFEFNTKLKKVREYPIPPQMQGQAIADGPMPFVFGVEKDKMKARYWVRVITPADAAAQNQVWLEAYPKYAKDATNFHRIEVILKFTLKPDGTIDGLQPYALNLIRPSTKDRAAYVFGTVKTDGTLAALRDWFNWFVRPNTPGGWSHELSDLDAPVEPAVPGQVPTGPPPGAGGIGAAPQPVVPR